MDRPKVTHRIEEAFRVHPVVALLGPRQCGKTTLARAYSKTQRRGETTTHFDLEDPNDLARLENPKLALQDLEGLIVIDEVQRRPDIFPVIRVLVDNPKWRKKARLLILGSASRDLIRQGSESLAGRIEFLELTPFTSKETGPRNLQKLWLRGGFPPSFLATSNKASEAWRKSYVATYLERDIPALGFQIPPQALRRFWLMLTHYHGQTFNASEIGSSLGVADTTVRRYLDILSGTFMIRQLHGWVANIGKRQVKTPKIFFRDSGIFHSLLNAAGEKEIVNHPKLGASWEGFALEEVIRSRNAAPEEVYFWGTHNDAELDLLIMKDGRREGFEFKYSDRPAITKSMRIAFADLQLDQLNVVHPGSGKYPLDNKMNAVGLDAI